MLLETPRSNLVNSLKKGASSGVIVSVVYLGATMQTFFPSKREAKCSRINKDAFTDLPGAITINDLSKSYKDDKTLREQ